GITSSEQTVFVMGFDQSSIPFFSDKLQTIKFIKESELSNEVLLRILRETKTPYFYLIRKNSLLDSFSFIPEIWSKEYVHVWGNDEIFLYNKYEVEKNINNFTDQAYQAGL